ncbi:MAG: hypothetical protein Q7T36_12885 [Fluviicoccus sp.]|uniref:Sel1-like repeat-containing protein kinase family protein n=1 Tax=Fluviicoccus sp. TaxID=2003552 RepID=UPI0027237F87|nr:hypothetical protein [Fluviicoccus sp.]MDO8331352.1 hypothetical protein [Fluviicoccus sp.]
MKTVADLFANNHVILGKTAPVDRHFVHVEKWPGDSPDGSCTWVKSVEPGQLQNEYWVAREKNLLLLLKKLPQVVHLRKDGDNSENTHHTVNTRDAGIPLESWLKMKPQHLASRQTLEHPFAHIGAFLRLARGLITALKSIHREGVIHANLDPSNICLPYQPFPFRFDDGIRPDHANISLIDFMFAISTTLRLYRPLAIKPLAPPSSHSSLFRQALENDMASQRADAVQSLDYSVDLYALGHLLEEIFQRGLIYPGNMQSQMEMTIYNLIQELLGFDEGIPDWVSEKYGSTLPHDIYLKRIDNMLSLDPHADNHEHDMLLLDPTQGLEDEDETAEEPYPHAEPHQPSPENKDPTGESLLMTASEPLSASPAARKPTAGLSSYFEINTWLVVAGLMLAQAVGFIYHKGDSLNLDVFSTLLLMAAVTGGLLLAMRLLAPEGSLIRHIEGEVALPGEPGFAGFDAAPPRQLRDDEYIHVSPLVVVAALAAVQGSAFLYAHGDSMGLDVLPSILLTLAAGFGFAAIKVWYDRFVTPKPITVIDDDGDETPAAMDNDGAKAVIAAVAQVEKVQAYEPPEDAIPVLPVLAAVAPVAVMTETLITLPEEVPETAAEHPAEVTPTPAETEEVPAEPAALPVVEEIRPVVTEVLPIEEDAPVLAEPVPTAAVISLDKPRETAVAAASAPLAQPEVAALPLAARTAHADPAEDAALLPDADGTVAAPKHLELDNRVVIVVVLLLLLLFFYLSRPDKSPAVNVVSAPPQPAPEVVEAPMVEDLGLPEAVPAVEPEAPTSMPTDTTILDSLKAQAKPRTAAVKPAKPQTAAKPGKAAEAEETETTTETVAETAPEAPAAEAAKPADAVKPAEAVAAAPAAPAKPLGNPLAQAQNIMGWHYFKGITVPKDMPEALNWFRKSAEMGDASGQFNLGMMYANGYGTAKNHTEAARWFKLAADQGKANAMLNLGQMYLAGRGVEQNTAEGIRLLKLSAEKGDKNAQANLDAIARSGKGMAAP